VTPHGVVDTVWVVWLVSWLMASAWAERAVKRPAVSSEIVYRVLTIAGALLLFGVNVRSGRGAVYRAWPVLSAVLWQSSRSANWALCGVMVAGVAFAWWARLHIGRLWSSSVGRKADHHVVDTGPYRLVRHPIYSGVLLSIYVTGVMRGTVAAVLGMAVITAGFYVKARLEERFLRQELGSAYDDYARRVGMLIPFLR
jgi:protein-S-isoprenylcysteine O-methyltransferase Ste14